MDTREAEAAVEAREPGKTLKDFVREWTYPLVAYAAAVSALLSLAPAYSLEPIGRLSLFAFVAFWAVMWSSFAFSGDPYLHRTHALSFSYFFILVSFTVFSLPAFFGNAVGGEPLGIVSGCVRDPTAPEQVRCQNPAVVVRQGAADEAPAAGPGSPPASAPTQLMQLSPASVRNQWLVNVGGTLRPQRQCDRATDAAARNVKLAEACTLGSPSNRVYVSGGLVVPLPFVIIALAGGAISLSRRVPEIQKKSETYDYVVPETARRTRSQHVPIVAAPEMSPADVRQNLMFQIVQFVSAPLVAAVAYQVIEPESAATSAGLAFMCGFGSEAVLRSIKSFAESIGRRKLGQTERQGIAVATGAVYGVVTSRGQPQQYVHVRVAHTVVGATTDHAGLFFLPGVQAGAQTLSVDGYDRPVSVHVVAGEARECPIDLDELEAEAADRPAGAPPVRPFGSGVPFA